MKKALLSLFIVLPFITSAQSELIKPQLELIGTFIDSITITSFIKNEPKNKDFNTKYKVLEFWATWCKPCLKAVPHLNKLNEKFKERDVAFISLTYEAPNKTLKTMQKVNFETIVATDTTRTIHRQLRIDHNGTMILPRTVVIDNENKILWYGTPKDLTIERLERLLQIKQSNKKIIVANNRHMF